MKKVLYLDEFNDKLKITIYGCFWDNKGEIPKLSNTKLIVWEAEVNLKNHNDLWALFIDVK